MKQRYEGFSVQTPSQIAPYFALVTRMFLLGRCGEDEPEASVQLKLAQ
jgi:hypothetical protein